MSKHNLHNHHNTHGGSFHAFVNGALFGTLIGTVLGVLLAPAPGNETRKKLKDAGENAKETLDVVKASAEPIIAEVERRVVPVLEQAMDASDPVKAEVMERVAQLFDEVNEKAQNTKKAAKKSKSNFFRGTSKG